MDPPQCVQNAMMTKDKKPFTYTPGGIDLSEVRSPRMQRRIERNANLAGAGDIPKPQPPPPQNLGALPPSVQACMRPQPQVQVFPSGPPPPPPMSRGGAPPPPPPFNAPPPPPPPSGPLPTQKVTTADNQVLERPDMTKIIPDNPMAMLRRTGGPAPRKSIVDELFSHEGKAAPAPGTPPSGQRPQPQYEQQQQRYQPPVVDRGAPVSPVPQPYQPQPQQYQQPRQQQYQPPQPQQQYQPPPAQQRSPEAAKEAPRYQPPVIERQPTIPRQNNAQPEVKTSTAHLGSLYIPPANQQAQPQRRVVSPPSPPERNTDSPGLQTPPLKEAPRPWQAKKPQQEEVPAWARRNEERPDIQNVQQTHSPPTQQQQPQQRWPQQQAAQQYNNQQPQYQQPQNIQQPQYQQPQNNQQIQQPAGVPVRIIIRTNTGPAPYQQPSQGPEPKTEAVYITQPIVLQHPGPRASPQQQQQQEWQQPLIAPPYKPENQGGRVVPIAVETNQGSQSPTTPGGNKSLNRQQSWGNNPTQSNTFKIIQKITQTDDDEEDEDAPVTEHGPRYTQNFQQLPAEQVRRMKLNEGDQNLMNKFKQVPSGPQPQRKGPQVRTIPVQIESDDPPQPYVHPSEQVVQEPKKYTGSSIPSRSFKILQAMTAPDNCANADEQYEATPYEQWGYDPNYPAYPPPPYWHDYYHYYYQDPQTGLSKDESTDTSARTTPRQTPTPRHTPVPFWSYMPPYPYPPPRRASTTEGESDAETSTNPRSTPLPYWGEEAQAYPQYPPYYDPYYYSYYYGYPPMYPPYPYYGPNSDSDDFAGYSSTDEMAYYNSQKGRRRNSLSGLRSATPRIVVTPTLNVKETVVNKKVEAEKLEPEPEEEVNTSESDSDTETEEDNRRNDPQNPIRSIRSVNNILLYAEEDDSRCSEDDDEVGIEEYTEDGNEEIDEENSVYIVDDDSYPHQLSVIYEESERTDSRMRSASAMSDSTTIAERSDDEDTSPNILNANKPFKFCVSVTEEEREEIKAVVSIGDREIRTFEKNLNSSIKEEEAEAVVEEYKEQLSPPEVHIHCSDEEEGKESDESEDWWGIIGKEDDLPVRPTVLKKADVSNDLSQSQKVDLKVIEPSVNKNVERIEKQENKKEKLATATHPIQKEPVPQKHEKDANPKNNYARAKSVYDKIEDQFEEEVNTGKLIEMESFVAQLEQMQKESGLWNLQLPRKVGGSKPTTGQQKASTKEATRDIKQKVENCPIKKEIRVSKPNEDEKINTVVNQADSQNEECNDVDFWSTLKSNEKEVVPRSKVVSKNSSASYNNYSYSKSSSEESEKKETTSVDQNTSYVEPINVEAEDDSYIPEVVESEDSSEEVDSSEDESEDHEQKENDLNNNEEKEEQPMSIQERIQALKETIKQKQSKLQQQQEQEIKTSVKDKISAIETTGQIRSKTTSTKSSLKSFEEYSEEEEGDSGVTSDMSRHISDTEEFPELKKLTRYQRAATHSRLFKLLQDECENEEDEEEVEVQEEKTVTSANTDKFSNLSVRKNNVATEEPPRRDKLSLPLNANETESLCSSGITSPGSPVNEKLVNELVQSLLKRKKGQMFRNMPKEKLFAAAARILQEDLEGLDASSEDCSSFLSPLRESTGCSTAAQTPQEFNGNYDEYKQYYDTWSEAERIYDENYDILPSKAFKLLQEHSNLSKTGTIAGLLAKCPRVLSSKNIHKKLLKLLESSDAPSPTPENPLESNEVTSAS